MTDKGQQFIEWAIWDFNENFEEVRAEAERAFYEFWNQPKEIISYLLHKKLKRGKAEHGETPDYTPEQLRLEFRDEQTDEAGYIEIDRWYAWKAKMLLGMDSNHE